MKAALKYSDLLRGAAIDYEKIGKVTAESVLKHTGRNWKQWVTILEKLGASSWSYQEIVAFLKKKYRLSPWWQHEVARGFEIAVGHRKEGQDARGKYMVTATKSLPYGVKVVWKTLLSEKGTAVWLNPIAAVEIRPKSQFETGDGFFGEIRTVATSRRLRLYWQDPLWEKHTTVEILLVPRARSKSILVFNHTGIKEIKSQDLLRVRWRKAADHIFQLLSAE